MKLTYFILQNIILFFWNIPFSSILWKFKPNFINNFCLFSEDIFETNKCTPLNTGPAPRFSIFRVQSADYQKIYRVQSANYHKATGSKVPFPKIYRVHGPCGPCTNAGPANQEWRSICADTVSIWFGYYHFLNFLFILYLPTKEEKKCFNKCSYQSPEEKKSEMQGTERRRNKEKKEEKNMYEVFHS